MKQDVLLITTFDLFVINRFIGFTVNPSNIQRSIFESAVEMIDKSHDPRYLNAAFNCKLPPSFHFLVREGNPWTNLGIPSDDNNLIKVNQAS